MTKIIFPKWEKCWKINGTPPIEVYETHINFFGTNISPDFFQVEVEKYERQSRFMQEAIEIWKKEFKK